MILLFQLVVKLKRNQYEVWFFTFQRKMVLLIGFRSKAKATPCVSLFVLNPSMNVIS